MYPFFIFPKYKLSEGSGNSNNILARTCEKSLPENFPCALDQCIIKFVSYKENKIVTLN